MKECKKKRRKGSNQILKKPVQPIFSGADLPKRKKVKRKRKKINKKRLPKWIVVV